ncbi:hypothetical protein CPB97_002496 [Podila verticillata]|nr:hypothetical protein CPB97_002496 [Podila verticillata]
MENKFTASPEHSLLLRHGRLEGLDEDEEEGEESRLDFNFEAIDADIDLDDSVRSNPRFTGLSGHESSGLTDISEGGPKLRKTIDRWSASTGKPATMTLKEQEKVIDELKKDSFGLKLKIYFLEERLAKISPEHVDQALHENIEMKVRLQTMHSELKQYKRLLLEAHAAIEALQNQKNCDQQHGMSEEQEEEYRQAIAERLDLKTALKRLSQQVESLENELRAKEAELQNQIGAVDEQADTIEELQRLAEKYKSQIQEMHGQIQEYQRNESRMMEKSRSEDGWEARCRNLEQDLKVSLELRSELENELMETRAEREAYEEDMNFQLQEHRDELSKAKLHVAELSGDLQAEREQLQQVQDMHTNDMNILSERWTQHRQQLQEQISMMSNEIEDLRKENDELAPQVQEFLILREEDEQRHHQEMTDLVAELEDKAVEIDRMAMELDQLRDVAGLLQAKDERIARLEDQVRQLELSRREADAVHDEMITRMKTKIQSGSTNDLREGGVSEEEFRMISEEMANLEEQNRKLESQVRLEIEQRRMTESAHRDRESNGFHQWKEERRQMEVEYTEKVDDLQEKLAAATEQISKLSGDLNDRESHLRFYEEQLDLASKQAKEIEDRYDEMELKLGSDLQATTAELLDIRQEFEQIKASRVDKGELLHARSDEVDRLNVKTRKLNDSMAALEEEKTQLETALRDRATTIAMLKSRLNELELQVSKNQWSDETPSSASKDELIERNSLLLTVLQHLESILGGDSRLDGNMLPKPSANFVYFSNHLISRLKSLSKLFILFEKKGKELEDKATGQLVHLKKQLDLKLKQMEKFETIVRNAADRQRKWREQLVRKQAETEELQAKNTLLAKTIADLKSRSVTNERVQEYETRFKHAERKLQMEKSKSMDVEERWNARLRELEKRTKDAEERVKRERQGAKEKVAGLLDENKVAQKNIESLQRKNVQLQELVDIHSQQQGSSTSSSQIRTSTELGLSRMNEQLRSELDQRSRMADKDREKARSTLRDLDSVNAQCYKLQQQLGQRENQIKSTLSKLEMFSQRRDVADNMGLRQATDDLYRSLDIDDEWD